MKHLRLIVHAVMLCVLFAGGITAAQAQSDGCDLSTADAFTRRGHGKYNNADYEGAAADYRCALALEETSEVSYWLARAYDELERYDEAIAAYNQALEIGGYSDKDIYNSRGITYLTLQEYELAEADFNACLTIDEASAPCYNNRGNIYYDQGDYERAIEDYTTAIDLPDDQVYIQYYNRGIANYELGRYAESLDDLTQALTLNPDYASAVLARGKTNQVVDPAQSHVDFLRYVEIIQTEVIPQGGELENRPLDMTGGRVYEISFEAADGQKASIAARASANVEIDPLIVLLDADRTPIASDDDSGVNLDAVVVGFEIPADGTYTLLVTHAFGGSEGEILLTVTLDGEPSRIFSIYTLAVGDPARVYTTEGDRLNLRSGPGLNFEIVGRLERETIVTLLEGPRKADGLAWWRVETADGLSGWSVERVDEEQTLQPPLVIGGEATVYPISGDLLNVREDAGRSFALVTQLAPGVVVTIQDGPQTADGFRWWKIQLPDGTEGWAVDEADGEQTLIGKAAE